MNHSLANIQSQFANALRYQNAGEHCDIQGDHFSVEQRIQIYRNHYVISTTDVLRATYPMVEALVGEECFDQLARQHALLSPPASGDITRYGEGFSKTIQHFAPIVDAVPYLPDTAEFEWCCDPAKLSLNQTLPFKIQPLSEVSKVSSSEHALLTFHLSPDLVLFSSSFAIFSLRQAIHNDQVESVNIDTSESGIVFHQQDGSIQSQVLSVECFELLTYLSEQQALGHIPPALLVHLNTLIELEVIRGFSIHH